ncbi:Formaldehyde dehydrogenase [Penicillium daleae]|uniref:Formaldehyde dehydrogenase n=1 Tax=Penicillium daleae TaxID=63821 RepID=A0AAD6C070_9EURO|nr:Formaldehyde dehydrogenase [Penicillium daleae]KAJ5440223.1 Formaldehyde dehydrogenase [Penicillium daleae]
MSTESRPKPTITDPSDAIIQVTHCTISGSDLHLYEGDLGDIMRKGDIMGREAIGLVDEVGLKVRSRKVGDRVIIIPVIMEVASGHCVSEADAEIRQYHPLLLDLVISGQLDPSWTFTYEDQFENIADHYWRFAEHEEPGGLQVVLAKAFGRAVSNQVVI